MKTFVFQGDSITDVGRARDNDINIGLGYPFLFAAKMGRDYPEEYAYLNRGISGNRIVDLYARIKSDIINLKPDYLSILIGVNDVWHEFSRHNGVDAEKYEKIYSMLIEEVKQALPDIKIIIMEPFLLKGPATEENWDEFYSEKKSILWNSCLCRINSLSFQKICRLHIGYATVCIRQRTVMNLSQESL